MKKLINLLFLGILMIACSNDDKVTNIDNESGKQVFEISTENRMNGPRIGDPVYSQAATQKITRITILAFLKGTDESYTYTRSIEVSGWTIGTTKSHFEVPETEKLPDGIYTFLAIGRDQTDQYEILPVLNNTITPQQVYASITESGNEYEIFTGQAINQEVVSGGGRFSLSLSRAVAGFLAYFQNVPQILNGKTVHSLRLTASAGNKQLFLFDKTGNSPSAGTYELISINLTSQEVENGVYQGNDLSGAGVAKLPKSQLDGGYIIPIETVTLTLGLYDESGATIRTWPVKNGMEETFNILPNHFYSLGKKLNPATTTGSNPESTEDDDIAINLLKDQVITLMIDPAWNTIHELTIE